MRVCISGFTASDVWKVEHIKNTIKQLSPGSVVVARTTDEDAYNELISNRERKEVHDDGDKAEEPHDTDPKHYEWY